MSGGSFDYLYRHTLAEALSNCSGELRSMEQWLRYLEVGAWGPPCPGAASAADELAALIKTHAALEERFRVLERVLKAVEWYRSNDWPIEEVTKALETWKAKQGDKT